MFIILDHGRREQSREGAVAQSINICAKRAPSFGSVVCVAVRRLLCEILALFFTDREPTLCDFTR